MTKIYKEFKDATTPFFAHIKPRHALHCKRRDAHNCVQARSINSHPNVIASKVYKTITYILFRGDRLPTRYQNSPEATYFACLNDTGGRRAIVERDPRRNQTERLPQSGVHGPTFPPL